MTPRTAWDREDGLWEIAPDDRVRWIAHVVFGTVEPWCWQSRERVEQRWGPLIPSA